MNLESVSISFILTLLIFSYLLGDNLLFRMAVAAFVGFTAAYTTIVILESVLLPLLIEANQWLQQDAPLSLNVAAFIGALGLGAFLLLKPIAYLKSLTNLAQAILIAVGAALTVAGALTGTIIPLTLQTASVPDSSALGLVNTIVIALGVVTTILYFQYLAQRDPLGRPQRGHVSSALASVGEVFIAVALGALYGTAILTSLTILTGHLSTLIG